MGEGEKTELKVFEWLEKMKQLIILKAGWL